MATIVISEFMDEASIEDLRREFAVLYDPALVDRPDDLVREAASARALIVRNRTQVRGPFLDACRALEVVGRLGVGLDNIDLDACAGRGIKVFPASGANDVSVAEYVLCAVMMLLRGAYHGRAEVAAGGWPRTAMIGRETGGRTLGLLGFGSIAREVAGRAKALGMTVIAHDPHLPGDHAAWRDHGVGPASFADLLARSDAVSLHVPLTAETRHLIDAAALAAMKADAVLINAARGGVVDEAALADALRQGRLAAAMLDVFEVEPLPAGSVLADVPNLFLTPHIAGVTVESNVRVSAVTAAQVRAALKGAA